MTGRKWMRTLPHDVYTIKNADGQALYVGLSVNTVRRLLQHRQKPWYSQAGCVEVETFKDWAEAKQAEGLRIRELDPPHNNQREAWSAAQGAATQPKPIARTEYGL